jgi:predicted TIM-barrel fold metal-dependent hydrolase
MKIDVHTHLAPDRIADRVRQAMEQMFPWKAPYLNTVAALKAHMREAGIDKSVVLGIAQEARHVRPANDWLIGIADEQLVPFGAMHPQYPDKVGEIRRLRAAGIKGIKLHPMVNQFYLDDPQLFPMYEEIGDTMVVLTHAGKLHADREETPYAAPQRILNVLRQFPKLRIIAAHLGGFYLLDEAERTLVGHPRLYLDTTWPPSIGEVGAEVLARIIRKHGAEKVMFGTDYCLVGQKEEAALIERLPIPTADKERILGENAREFIGL